jgi:multiple sugar transport system ATP-binding protein
VVTNSIRIADLLTQTPRPGRTVVLTGGTRTPSDALVGPIAVQALGTLHLDRVFMGVHGMSERAGFTTPNLLEAETNQAFVDAAEHLVVLADHTKWDVTGLATIARARRATTVITDAGTARRRGPCSSRPSATSGWSSPRTRTSRRDTRPAPRPPHPRPEESLMATVTFQNATRIYPGTDAPRSTRFDLEIADGEFLVLVGPSGCGKSTTLRMLAGLEPVDDGSVYIGDRDVTMMPPKDRDIAMVFQSYALYPHMTVAENIGFHLKIKKVPKPERAERVREAARILDLEDYLDRKPAKLSGGQRQRVAMGRAIVRQPQVFLMDEPLSNLDAKLRVQTRTQIAALQRRLGVTTVYVTHDQVEAMTMGDRVAVLKDGVLQQCATPRELFTRPVNAFVAGFIGSPAMNLLQGTVDGDDAVFGTLRLPLSPGQREATTTSGITIGVRPEGFTVSSSGGLDVYVEVVEELGSESFLYCRSTTTVRVRPTW